MKKYLSLARASRAVYTKCWLIALLGVCCFNVMGQAKTIKDSTFATGNIVAQGITIMPNTVISPVSGQSVQLNVFNEPPGASKANPVYIGPFISGQTFTDHHNNTNYPNDEGDNFGQPSPQIYYKFSLGASTAIDLSLCGSDFDTYAYILDASGNILYSNDDNGPDCTGKQSSIQQTLNTGTYYIVAEGKGNATGNISLNLSATGAKTIVTGFSDQMTQIFAPLEKARVPTGYLLDATFDHINLNNFDGSTLTDSNYVNTQTFTAIYKTLIGATINTNAAPMLTLQQLNDQSFVLRKPGTVVLNGLYYNYAKFTNDAASSGKVTVSNNQISDVYINGVWQNPYETKGVFAVTALTNSFKGTTQTFIMPSFAWQTNNMSIDHINFDPGDGQGVRTLGINQPVTVTYPDTGAKIITFSAVRSDGYIIGKNRIRAIITQDRYAGSLISFPIIATEPVDGKLAQGYMTVRYRDGNTRITKPFIVAEGFDYGYITKPEEPFGENSASDFIQKLNNSSSLLFNSLVNIHPTEYDLIYIDWVNGVDDIRRNAMLFKEAIRLINAEKAQVGSTEQNIVMGTSMGGLIARWALKDMENHNENHQTSLFISDDSPQLGANVPIAFQFAANNIKKLYLKTGAAEGLINTYQLFTSQASWLNELNLAHQPAVRQMLVNWIDDNGQIDNSVHNDWQSQLKTMGYPVGYAGHPLRRVAVSNGSECASLQDVGEGGALFTLNGKISSSFVGEHFAHNAITAAVPIGNLDPAIFVLNAFPGNSSLSADVHVNAVASNGGNVVYSNHIYFTKRILSLININVDITNDSRTAPSGILPFDSYPGSFQQPIDDKTNGILSATLSQLNVAYYAQPKFGFVPTASALDIGGGNVSLTDADYKARYIGASPPTGAKASTFTNFTTAITVPSTNELHLALTTLNANWIYNEVKANTPQEGDCTLICDGLTITGPALYCSGGTNTYSVNTVNNAQIMWNISGSGTIIGSYTSPTVQVSANSGSSFTLSVTITTNCDIQPSFYATKTVGDLDISNLTIQEFPNLHNIVICPGIQTQLHYLYKGQNFINGNVFGITSVVLTPTYAGTGTMQVTPYNANYWSYTAYHSVYIPTGGTTATKYAALTFTDLCNNTYGTFILYQQCSQNNTNAVRYYPNPASTILNVVYGNNSTSTADNAATPALTIEQAYAQYKLDNPNVIMAPLDPVTLQQAHNLDNSTIIIKLYNSLGIALINITKLLSTNSTTLDISTLPNGTYFLHTIINGVTEKKQIIISH